jgi:ABC-type lipopolysaccharide export system ATPase subunit
MNNLSDRSSTSGPQPILRTEKLRVEYRSREIGQERQAWRFQGLEPRGVSRARSIGFLGPNGAGKTTTMNVLLGFANATERRGLVSSVAERPPAGRPAAHRLPAGA